MTKELILSRGMVTLVDADVYEWASQWKWYAMCGGSTFYAARNSRSPSRKETVLLHRMIMKTPIDMRVDHINGDGLDNQRINLRLATNQENMCNRPMNANNTSGFKGVSWQKERGKWVAQIGISGKIVSLGRFDSLETAARAYDKAALEHFGEFARLNFP